jgi:predicted transglutaminase-like cysteine proteinase
MKRTKFLLIAGSIFTMLAFSSNVNASPLGSSLRDFGGSKSITVAPLAYHLFCLNSPKQCSSTGRSTIHFNSFTMATLHRINSRVNHSIRYVADKGDVWGAKGGKGDCEDYVLEKRRKLIASGFPAGALRMAAVTTSRGEAHAVLLVKTTRGDFVLDNARTKILTKNKTGYRWNAVATANPLKWLRL